MRYRRNWKKINNKALRYFLSTLLLLAFGGVAAQVSYCKFKREGDCAKERAIKCKSKHLDRLIDLYEREAWDLTYLQVTGKINKSEAAPDLAKIPLKWLTMRKAGLKQLPEWVYEIQTLEQLDVGDNYIAELGSQLCDLHQLSKLVLWVNDLHNLPFCVNQMEELRTVDMSGIKLNVDEQKNLRNSFRAVDFIFSDPCLCNFQEEE